jgi:hypothetical protein
VKSKRDSYEVNSEVLISSKAGGKRKDITAFNEMVEMDNKNSLLSKK